MPIRIVTARPSFSVVAGVPADSVNDTDGTDDAGISDNTTYLTSDDSYDSYDSSDPYDTDTAEADEAARVFGVQVSTRWFSMSESRASMMLLRIAGLVVYTVLLIGGSALLTSRIAAAGDSSAAEPAPVSPAPISSSAPTSSPAPAPSTTTPPPAPTTPPPPPPPAPPVRSESLGDAGLAEIAVQFALSQVGVPYVWGGAGARGYDCSGLTMRAYQAAGISLPHRAALQAHKGVRVHTAKRGDLVISNHGGHVAMALGDGRVVEAPQPGQKVSIHSMPRHPTAIVRLT